MNEEEIYTDEDFAKIAIMVNEKRRVIEKDPVNVYLRENSLRLTNEQKQLIKDTKKCGVETYIQMSEPEEMALVANLIRAINAKKVIEVGSLTGYSALTIALALPENGYLIACDINDLCIKIGRKHWKAAGVDDKIQVRLDDAKKTMTKLLNEAGTDSYDLVYIDADKVNYDTYYELSLKLVRPKGLIVISNVYYYGTLEDNRFQDTWTAALRKFNHKLKTDERIDLSMLRLGDGLTIAVKR